MSDYRTKAGSPEEYFVVRPDKPNEVNFDVLSRLLKRINAATMTLQGKEYYDNYQINLRHDIVIDAIDNILGLTQQAITVVDRSFC